MSIGSRLARRFVEKFASMFSYYRSAYTLYSKYCVWSNPVLLFSAVGGMDAFLWHPYTIAQPITKSDLLNLVSADWALDSWTAALSTLATDSLAVIRGGIWRIGQIHHSSVFLIAPKLAADMIAHHSSCTSSWTGPVLWNRSIAPLWSVRL